MIGKGDLVSVHPRWTNRGGEDTVYVVTGTRWDRHCREMELLDPLTGNVEGVSEYHVQRLKSPPMVNT